MTEKITENMWFSDLVKSNRHIGWFMAERTRWRPQQNGQIHQALLKEIANKPENIWKYAWHTSTNRYSSASSTHWEASFPQLQLENRPWPSRYAHCQSSSRPRHRGPRRNWRLKKRTKIRMKLWRDREFTQVFPKFGPRFIKFRKTSTANGGAPARFDQVAGPVFK